MKSMIYIAIVVVVLIGFKLLLTAREAAKRKKEKNITDPAQLPARKLTHTFCVSSSDLEALIAAIQKYEPRVASKTSDTLIAYTGEAGTSLYDGVLNTPSAAMPLRVIAQVKNEKMEIRLDEDYGFQMFVGPAKSAYTRKYEEGFQLFETLVVAALV